MLLAVDAVRHAASTARSRSRRTVRFRTVGDATCTGAVESTRGDRRRRDRRGGGHPHHRAGRHPGRRPHQRGRRWKTASARATSDGRAAALRHRRLRRRRQVDAHRPAALRLEGDLRGPARGGRAHVARAGRRVHQPRAAHRRPAGRARAGHHHRRRLPLLRHAEAQVHHRRHARATSSTRATWSPARRPPTWRWSSSTPARACSSRAARHAFLASLLGIPHLVLCVNKMDLVDYDEERVRARSRTSSASSPMKLDVARPHVRPDLGAARRQRREPLGQHAVVRGLVAAAPPRRGAHRVRPQPHRRPLPGAVRDPPA